MRLLVEVQLEYEEQVLMNEDERHFSLGTDKKISSIQILCAGSCFHDFIVRSKNFIRRLSLFHLLLCLLELLVVTRECDHSCLKIFG